MEELIVLIHSPLVGAFTWSRVAQSLRAGGLNVLAPALTDRGGTPPPYWQQHAACVREALAPFPPKRPLVLVGHSGAGPLLPAIGRASGHPIRGNLFVDAGLPHPGESQMEESAWLAQELRRLFAGGERFPNWKEEDLLDELPDEGSRRRVLSEMQPRALDYFAEVQPEIPGWTETPGAYLLFTEGYRPYLDQAQRAGWPTRELPAGHFHMLVDPASVAASLSALIEQIVEKQ